MCVANYRKSFLHIMDELGLVHSLIVQLILNRILLNLILAKVQEAPACTEFHIECAIWLPDIFLLIENLICLVQ